jgi:hypothetical protein
MEMTVTQTKIAKIQQRAQGALALLPILACAGKFLLYLVPKYLLI